MGNSTEARNYYLTKDYGPNWNTLIAIPDSNESWDGSYQVMVWQIKGAGTVIAAGFQDLSTIIKGRRALPHEYWRVGVFDGQVPSSCDSKKRNEFYARAREIHEEGKAVLINDPSDLIGRLIREQKSLVLQTSSQ
jgi:hypothetical protein